MRLPFLPRNQATDAAWALSNTAALLAAAAMAARDEVSPPLTGGLGYFRRPRCPAAVDRDSFVLCS